MQHVVINVNEHERWVRSDTAQFAAEESFVVQSRCRVYCRIEGLEHLHCAL